MGNSVVPAYPTLSSESGEKIFSEVVFITKMHGPSKILWCPSGVSHVGVSKIWI